MRLAGAILALSLVVGSMAEDYCPLPPHARGGKLFEKLCASKNSLRDSFSAQLFTKQTLVDHNNPGGAQFTQRYWVSAQYRQGSKAVSRARGRSTLGPLRVCSPSSCPSRESLKVALLEVGW
jgi:hypothetical protein